MSFASAPIWCLLIAMFSIQFGASIAKQLFPIVGAGMTSGLRLFFAALLLLTMWQPWKYRLSKHSYLLILGYGASLGFMNLLFYYSLERIPLGIAVALEFAGPLAISLLQSRKPLDFVWAFLATLGIYLVLPLAAADISKLDLLGVVLALAAGFCWALYIYFGEKAGNSGHIGSVTSLGMLVAALVVIPFALLTTVEYQLNYEVVKMGFLIAILSSALPYSLEMVALKNIPTKTFGILMSLEPATAALMGFLNLKEVLTPVQIIAIFCIIIASMGTAITSRKKV